MDNFENVTRDELCKKHKNLSQHEILLKLGTFVATGSCLVLRQKV